MDVVDVTAPDFRIKLLRIKSKLRKSNRRECLRELFNWLAGQRFKTRRPDTEEEWTRVLIEISQQVYDIARAEGWIWKQQVRMYVISPNPYNDPHVDAMNRQEAHDAFRLPTADNLRDSWFTDLILEWQARFLESQNCSSAPAQTLESASSAVPPRSGDRSDGTDLNKLIAGKEHVNVETAARHLGCSPAHITRLARTGKLERVGMTKPIKISTSSLRKYKGE